uniref:Uncharacterized protein n=1 Tax=Aegilops tauschii subsp. strangulata TaxID=200361 RepID=A0A453MHU7_AEGTS
GLPDDDRRSLGEFCSALGRMNEMSMGLAWGVVRGTRVARVTCPWNRRTPLSVAESSAAKGVSQANHPWLSKMASYPHPRPRSPVSCALVH